MSASLLYSSNANHESDDSSVSGKKSPRINRLAFRSLGLVLAASWVLAIEAAPAAVRIMPLGDSITYGWSSTNIDGYRRPLYLALTAAGHDVDFVGSLAHGSADFDRDHEGHSGWRADQIRDNIVAWLTANPADIILLHIGTNDISQGESASNIRTEVEQILNNIDQYELNNDVLITVVLARIINRGNPLDGNGIATTAYNNALQVLADARVLAGDRIIVVDQEAALTYPTDLADALHPNDGGYAKMANAWFPAVDGLLSGTWVTNLTLSESPALRQAAGDLVCDYTLVGPATTAVTAWYRDAAPWALLNLPMEGGAANALRDYSGNALTVTTVGAPTWSATGGHDGGGAFAFDGDESLYGGENFPTGSSYTKVAWVYRTGSGANGGNNIISGDENAGGHAFWAPDTYTNLLSAGHNQNWNIVQDSAALALNTWYHVGVSYDHATGEMVLYRDGDIVDSAIVPPADRNVTDPTITIGAFHGQVQFAWRGTIDDARIYPFVLTPEQVDALHAIGGDIVAPEETDDGDEWQCRVTPFTMADVGTTSVSNILSIGPCVPQCAARECGDDSCGGSCGTCGFGEVCEAGTCGIATGPAIANLLLSSTSGNDLTTDDLTCTFNLAGTATTAAIAWYLDAAPLMRLFMPMEGGPASAQLDYSGNALTVTTVGAPTWSATGGHDGSGAFAFDGDESLYGGENFPTGSSYTKVAWVYRTGSGANGGNNIISGDENAGGHAFWAPDLYSNLLSAGHNGNWSIVQDSTALALNTWYHVAVSYDHATGAMVLYRNGTAVDSGTVPAQDRNVSDSSITIGAFHNQVEWAWKGAIDDARIYTRALSPELIAMLYAGGGDVIAAPETEDGDAWQCGVTGFSATEAGATESSNTILIGGPCVPDCTGRECGDDGCGGSCGTCGLDQTCVAGICTSDFPLVDNVVLNSTSGNEWDSDDLLCSYDLGGTATTAATAWFVDGVPQMAAYLPMEGGPAAALLDYSGSNHHGTAGGDPEWLPGGGRDGGGCFDFDGNDQIDLGNVLTGGAYTKTAWVRYLPGETYNNIISGQANHAFWVHSTGGAFRLTSGHNGAWDTVVDPVAFPENTWVFVGVTYDGSNLRLYRNGSQVHSATGVAPINADNRVYVGGFTGTCCWFKGQIDDARVYTFALSPAQIARLYAGGAGDSDRIAAAETQVGEDWECQVTPFSVSEAGNAVASATVSIVATPPPDVHDVVLSSSSGHNLDDDTLTCSYTLDGTAVTGATAWYLNDAPLMRLYLPMEGGSAGAVLDRSGNSVVLTPGSDPAWIATGGFDGYGAIEFDGDDDFGAGENFPTNSSYTKSAWVYRTGSGANGGNNVIAGNENAGGHAFWAPDMYGNKLSAGHNAHWNTVQDSVALALNTWYHVALTFDRATGQLVLYKNGVAVDSEIVPSGDLNVTDATISIGSFGAANGYKWKGLLDDVRVYARALSTDQIAALYSGGAGDRDTITATETNLGDTWECRVTPFSPEASGDIGLSNPVTIVPPGECQNNDDCADGYLCTLDVCDATTCAFPPVDCGSQVCNPADGACVDCISTLLLDEDFNTNAVCENPYAWLDTDADNSMLPNDALFAAMALNGDMVLGTDSTLTNIHSHYVSAASATWSSYDLTGRVRISDAGASIGVTFLSDFPDTNTYYRLRRLGTMAPNTFHLDQHPDTPQNLAGDTDTGVVPVAGQWLRIHVRVEVGSTQTSVRANVWPDGELEPSTWQADAVDDSATRLIAGRVGVWSHGPDSKYWDDLRVVERGTITPLCDDGNVCTADLCQDYACAHLPANEGADCADGDVCTADEVCTLGECVGVLLDCDADGVCDPQDNCPTVPNDAQADTDGDLFGDACDAIFDADHDGDVDVRDLASLVDCLGGPASVASAPCRDICDADQDDDVDLMEFLFFQEAFTGAYLSPCDF